MQEGRPLASWKAIAAYLGVSVRTVQRWQSEGLPVHRRPSGPPRSVHAFTQELDAWLRQRDVGPLGLAQAPTACLPTVAVRPLVHTGPIDTDDFAGGMTEELMHALSGVEGVRVIPCGGPPQWEGLSPPDPAGRIRAADYTLEGTVRNAGGRVRVTVRLVDVADGATRLSRRFDRHVDDVFDAQDGIADEFAQQLQRTLAPVASRAADAALDAYQAYLDGRFALHKGNLRSALRARTLYEHAIAQDPHHAPSQCGLAFALMAPYIWGLVGPECVPVAVGAAQRAVQLSPQLSEAHSVLGLVRALCEWDWAAAAHHGQLALDLNRSLPDNWYRYAQGHLVPMGRFAEAIDALRQAVRLDSLSPFIQAGLAWTCVAARRPADALAATRRVLQLDPLNVKARWAAAWAHQLEGRHDEAVHECETARECAGEFPFILAQLGRAYALAGRTHEAEGTLDQLQTLSATTYTPHFCIAYVHLGLGRLDHALTALEAGIDAREPQAFFLGAPIYEPLQRSRRFRRLVRHVGLTP